MKASQRRLRFVLGSLLVMAGAAALLLSTFRDNLIFFYTPTQWQEKFAQEKADTAQEIRLGGLVKTGSIRHDQTGGMNFTITDLTHDMPVYYRGLLPSLFREGQGVVAQGKFDSTGMFQASTILAKHDENYMPREVVDALKKSGRWQQ